MAEKTEEKKAPSSLENLTCPLCLDIFDEATILTLCGHTFCRKCLKNYDLSHQDLDHMICPLCRKITKLSANRVDDFLINMTVNGLVDNYHAECGGMNAVLEMRPKCTACMVQQDAVSFCCTCNNYICDKCLDCHKHLRAYKSHDIISIQDINNGKVSIGHLSEKCCIHEQENKDMFCEDCKVHVCLKCVIVGHQNHNIKNQADFEKQLRLKVNDLVQRCATKKSELEKNIQNVEVQRNEVFTAVQKLLNDVSQAYSIKAKELEENHRNLIEQINAVKRNFDDELNVLKSKDRQRIKSICSSITLVANDRLGRLETDSLSAHTLLCEELDAMLREATDNTSAAAMLRKKAQETRFKPAYDIVLTREHLRIRSQVAQSFNVNDLVQRCAAKKTELEKNIQNVEVQRHEVYTAVQKLLDDVSRAYSIKAKELEENHRNLIEQMNAVKRSFDDELNVLKSKDRQRIKGICSSITLVSNDRLCRLETDSLSAHTLLCEELDSMLKEATDHISAAVITKKAQEKKFKAADDTRLDLGSISESDPKLQVIKCVDLRGCMHGMTQYSDDGVAIGYGDSHDIDTIDSAGKQEQYANIPTNKKCYDLVFQQDRSLCISMGPREVHIYYPNGSRKSTIHVNSNDHSLRLNRSPSDEILIANNGKKVYIYDPTESTLKHTVSTKHNMTQVSATRSGLIVTCSCYPSVVTVYDRNGNAGKSLEAPNDVLLYAAVDEQDRVYVASVDRKKGNVVIRLYDLKGLNLKERVEFNVLNLTLEDPWCYLVSLSPDMLAFARHRKLYFIKVSL
eukprot:XP_011673292.1 PREDICTED: uncharacterized protein LOC586935 [Strongylocentrotus purpuratus]